jgi:hypothetical protein
VDNPNIDVPVKAFTDGINKAQIQVFADFDDKKHRFFMLNWHRRARKTTLAINLLIAEACTYSKIRVGYITSTYTAAKNIVWRDPNMLNKYLPEGAVVRKNETELYVEFVNGSILSIHGADNPDSLRGIDFRGVVLDEWAFISPSVWEEIIRPIIAQSVDRWAMFIFTPNGRNHAHDYWIRHKDNPEWGRYELNVDQSKIIPQTELDKIKLEIPQRVYSQEFMCVFGDDASGVFKGVDQCVYGQYEPKKANYSYVTGVDLAKHEDYTVIMTLCRETRHFVSFRRFNHLEWSVQKEAIIDEVTAYGSMCVVDATGVGDPIAEDLARAGINIKPFKITGQNKKELIDRLAVGIEQRLITFPANEQLIDELKSYAYYISDAGNIKFGAPEGMHDDTVISMALAVWGARNFIYGKKLKEDRQRANFRRARFNQRSNVGFQFA